MSSADHIVHPLLVPNTGIKASYTRIGTQVCINKGDFSSFADLKSAIASYAADLAQEEEEEAPAADLAQEESPAADLSQEESPAADLSQEEAEHCSAVMLNVNNLWTENSSERAGIIDILLCVQSFFPFARRLTLCCTSLAEAHTVLDLSRLSEIVENVGIFIVNRRGPLLTVLTGPALKRAVLDVGANTVQSVVAGEKCEIVAIKGGITGAIIDAFYVHRTNGWATCKPYLLE